MGSLFLSTFLVKGWGKQRNTADPAKLISSSVAAIGKKKVGD